MNRKVLFVVILLLFLAFGIWVYGNIEHPETKTEYEDNLLSGLAGEVGTQAHTSNYIYYDWVNEDGSIVPLTGQQFGVGTQGSDSLGQYGSIQNNDISQVTQEFLAPILNASNEYYQGVGFKVSKTNTSTVPDEIGMTYSGYMKDDTKCLTKLYLQTDPFGYFFCGTVDYAQQKLMQEFSGLFPYEKNSDGSISTYRITKVVGDFANGSVYSGGPGGYQFIAKKVNHEWKPVWEGQDFPLCSDMEKYQVPESMYPGCYDPNIQDVKRTYDTD